MDYRFGGLLFFHLFTAIFVGAANWEVGVRDFTPPIQPGSEHLPSEAREFENGNTFVRVLKPVTGDSVRVWIPETMTADQLMEALIKVRIASSEGARQIWIVSSVEASELKITEGNRITTPPLSDLFHIAGAEKWQVHKQIHNIFPTRRLYGRAKFPFKKMTVSGTTHPALTKSLALELGYDQMDFESIMKAKELAVLLVAPSIRPVNATLFSTLHQIRTLHDAGHPVVYVTPYLPYARSDKKDQPGVAITGRLVADLIEAQGTDAISFVRAHAPQSEGFFTIPTFHINGRKVIEDYLKMEGVQAIVSPDAGFQKDATLLAVELDIPVDVINKRRELASGESHVHEVGGLDLAGLTVALPDDETASGGTQASSAEFLKKRGVLRVIGVATHLTGSAKKALESKYLDRLVVTDSNPITISHEKLQVLSIAPAIAEGLRGLFTKNNDCQTRLSRETIERETTSGETGARERYSTKVKEAL